jgi:hypothetical protein
LDQNDNKTEVTRLTGNDKSDARQHLSAAQERAVLELLEATPWERIERALSTIDESLSAAMRMTAEEYRFWQDKIAAGPTELDHVALADLPDEWRLAFVAAVLRNACMAYGLTTDIAGGPIGMPCPELHHAATPLRRLLQILGARIGTPPAVMEAIDDLDADPADIATGG